MRISTTSPPNLDLRIAQQSQVERDIGKLKFHLRMKRKLFDPTELSNISQRMQKQQQQSNRLKKNTIHLKAFQLLNKPNNKNSSYKGFTDKYNPLAHSSKPSRQKTEGISQREKQSTYRVNHSSLERYTSNGNAIAEYEITPTSREQQIQLNHPLMVRLKNKDFKTRLEKQQAQRQRFISDFQRNIKQRLKKIALKRYQNIQQMETILKKQQIKLEKSDKIARPTQDYERTSKLGQPKRQKKQKRLQQIDPRLLNRIARCKTQLRDQKKLQVEKIRLKDIEYDEKHRLLSNCYEKFSNMQIMGDQSALQLMSAATLARADLYLNQR